MSQTNESGTVYEGSYFKAFVNEKQMLEIETVGNDNFICMVSMIDDGSWADMYIDRMKDELDEIREMFIDTSYKYDFNNAFGINLQESLDELTIRRK